MRTRRKATAEGKILDLAWEQDHIPSASQLAKLMGCSQGTVSKRISDLRRIPGFVIERNGNGWIVRDRPKMKPNWADIRYSRRTAVPASVEQPTPSVEQPTPAVEQLPFIEVTTEPCVSNGTDGPMTEKQGEEVIALLKSLIDMERINLRGQSSTNELLWKLCAAWDVSL